MNPFSWHSAAPGGGYFFWKLPLLYNILLLLGKPQATLSYNGDMDELDCPAECDCHYVRVNWVTDCSESNLTQIPFDKISSNVYTLDMTGNHLTEVEAFPSGVKLRRLQLSNNQLTMIHREPFFELDQLIDVDFSRNQIRWIDPFTFHNKAGFLTLDMQGNPLDSIEAAFLHSKTLLYLDLSHCHLEHLNSEFFSSILSLSSLDLSHNPLRYLNASVLQPLINLSSLKLNFCNLSRVDPDAFSNQSNLRFLELAGNQFKDVAWPQVLHPLVRLELIDLQRSGLTSTDLNSQTFNDCSYLRTIILAENHFSDLNLSALIGAKLLHLEQLDLSYCDLKKSFNHDSFANATKLKSLDLSGNFLHSADLLQALAPLNHLRKLSLSDSGLKLLPDTLDQFRNLKELDISHNPLSDNFVASSEMLEYLNMGYSNLSQISPKSFRNMTSLKRLVLSGNDLNSLDAGVFDHLTHLKILELNFCNLNSTILLDNLNCSNLIELQLSGNPLKMSSSQPLLPQQVSRLETLDLSNCNLTFLPTEAFIHTPNIISLNLSGNRFSTSSEMKFLQILPDLYSLDLCFNNLTNISAILIENNAHLHKLQLIGNPWRCNCWISTFFSWTQENRRDLDLTIDGSIKNKSRKQLLCLYDEKEGKSRQSSRSWAKFVRESGCSLPKRTKRDIAQPDKTAEEDLLAQANHVANTWSRHLIIATIFYFGGLFIIYLIYSIINAMKPHRTRSKPPSHAKRAK